MDRFVEKEDEATEGAFVSTPSFGMQGTDVSSEWLELGRAIQLETSSSVEESKKSEAAVQIKSLTPALARALAELEDELRCPLCGSLVRAPVSLRGCSHVACSGCLRRAFARRAACPVCRIPGSLGDGDLHIHGPLASVSRRMAAMRSALGTVLRSAGVLSRSVVTADVLEAPSLLPESVPATNTSGGSEGEHAAKEIPPPLTTPTYSLYSDQTLRSDLKRWGVSTKGKRDELLWRHAEFVTSYNAARDDLVSGGTTSLRLSDIAGKVRRSEAERNRLKKLSEKIKSKTSSSTTSIDPIFQEMALKLIDQARQRRRKDRIAAQKRLKRASKQQKVDSNPPKILSAGTKRPNPSESSPPSPKKPKSDTPQQHSLQEAKQSWEQHPRNPKWQVLWSQALQRPFYFDTERKQGQWDEPLPEN